MEFIIRTGKWIAAAAIALMLTMPALAADIAGHIVMVKGEASAVTAGGSSRLLKRRDPVYTSDTITTGGDSRVQIRFIDNGLLALKANSQLAIHNYHQSADGQDDQVLLELVEGGFRTLTGSIGKGNKEAYRVETPVASIGIRGTLYSALLRDGKLVAGVWKGGITLFTEHGNFDLGMGADFSFATLGAEGFTGSMSAPATLDDGPDSTEPDNANGNGGTEHEGYGLESKADDGEDSLSLPNPLDQDNDGNTLEALKEEGLVEQEETPGGGNGNGGGTTTLVSPDIRLSNDEYAAFLQGSEAGVLLVDGQAVLVASFRDDDGDPIMISLDDGRRLDITRFEYQETAGQTGTLDGIAGLEWGIWNGSAETPVERYLDDNSLTVSTVESPVYWILADPVHDSVLSTMSGVVTFAGSTAFGTDSQGNSLTSASGSFMLDFASGQISNGQLYASYGGLQNSLPATGNWSASFNGTILAGGQATAFANITLTDGNYYDLNENMLALDISTSTLQGMLTAPNANAFVGSFQLNTVADPTSGNSQSASGLIVLPQVLAQ